MNDSRYNSRRRKKRKTRKWVKWTIGIIVLLLVAVLSFGGYLFYQGYHAAKKSYEDLDRPGEKSALRDKAPAIGKEPFSILLEGIEDYSTGGKNGRADTMIVVTLNPDTNKMTMTTIPRDWRVQLPANAIPASAGSGYHKLNAAHAYGGASGYGADRLTVETVEKLLDVPIDKYVAVDFKGFASIVDELGGVTVDVKKPFWEKNIFDHDKRIYFKEGPTHMDGAEALAFVRMRKRAVNNVYSREERQRQFIRATIKQAVSAGTIFKIDDISDILGKHVKTNLTPKEIYFLERAYSSMDSSSIKSLNIEGEDTRIPAGTGPYYWIPNEDSLNKVKGELKEALGLSPTGTTEDSGTSSGNATGTSSEHTDSEG